jgi:hypothetical protein
MIDLIFENPARTVEIARNVVAVAAVLFFGAVAIWAVNGIRNTEV